MIALVILRKRLNIFILIVLDHFGYLWSCSVRHIFSPTLILNENYTCIRDMYMTMSPELIIDTVQIGFLENLHTNLALTQVPIFTSKS